MNRVVRVAQPPAKPTIIYDGDCRFCTLWIRRWQQETGDAIEYLASQDVSVPARFPEIPRQELETAVQLVETDGRVISGAAAVFRAVAKNPSHQWLLRRYEAWPWFAAVTEWTYRFIARNRPLFSWFTRLLFGAHVERPQFFLARWIFLRALGLIYLVAFVSLWTQVDGLIGSNGILPADKFMPGARQYFDSQGVGLDRYRQLPTLAWWSASDASLHAQCAAGVGLALLLIAGVAPAPCLFLLWLIYLSLAVVAREFLGFQWDILLLEIGFLAIFLAPLQLWPRPGREAPPSRVVLWLLRLLLFKLMFQSGCVKLVSEDAAWRDLTALAVHYETQPLPTWIGWYAHQLPLWFQKFSCVVMFAIELVIPFLIFAPRRPRQFAAVVLALFQILILLTGNYTFFNWLTLALCVVLLDDFAFHDLTPARLRRFCTQYAPRSTRHPAQSWPRWVILALAALVLPISLGQLLWTFRARPAVLTPVAAIHEWISPFRSLNSYGLFAVMTQPRLEIIVEGSNDGVTWLPYEFRFKPGDLSHRPGFVAPHQPRLDWQMWFAALGNYQGNPWFVNFCARLLQASPEALALLEKNPFPNQPPRQVRGLLYEYHFTDLAERRHSGNWWRRELKAQYLPAISRSDLRGD